MQGVDRGHEVVRAAEHAEATVDRVADQRADRQHRVQPVGRLRRERSEFQAVALGGIEQHAAERAGQRHGAESAARRCAGVDQQFGNFDCVVEGLGADHAGLAGDRVERLDRAGERAGMCQRGVAASLRQAELDRHHRFSGGARQPARGLEFRDVGDRLDVDDDDLDLGLAGEERDVVRKRQAGFVSAGDQVARCNAALQQRLVGVDHHAAALADQCDRAGADRERPVLGQRHEPALGADVAHAVGAGDGKAGLDDHLDKLAAKRGGLGVEAFTEAGRKYRCAARPSGRAALERLDHAGGWHHDHHVIGLFGQGREVRIAGPAPDLGAARIDQVDRSGEPVGVEVLPDLRGPAARAVARANKHGITGRGQCRDFFSGEFEVQQVPLHAVRR